MELSFSKLPGDQKNILSEQLSISNLTCAVVASAAYLFFKKYETYKYFHPLITSIRQTAATFIDYHLTLFITSCMNKYLCKKKDPLLVEDQKINTLKAQIIAYNQGNCAMSCGLLIFIASNAISPCYSHHFVHGLFLTKILFSFAPILLELRELLLSNTADANNHLDPKALLDNYAQALFYWLEWKNQHFGGFKESLFTKKKDLIQAKEDNLNSNESAQSTKIQNTLQEYEEYCKLFHEALQNVDQKLKQQKIVLVSFEELKIEFLTNHLSQLPLDQLDVTEELLYEWIRNSTLLKESKNFFEFGKKLSIATSQELSMLKQELAIEEKSFSQEPSRLSNPLSVDLSRKEAAKPHQQYELSTSKNSFYEELARNLSTNHQRAKKAYILKKGGANH